MLNPPTQSPNQSQPCPNCKVPMAQDDRFCESCGTPLQPALNAPGPSATVPATPPAPPVAPLVAVRVDTGATFPITGELVIGKTLDCAIAIAEDPYVSRRHGRLRWDGGQLVVEDLASANGTLVRAKRPLVLLPGDEVVVGTTRLRIEAHGAGGRP